MLAITIISIPIISMALFFFGELIPEGLIHRPFFPTHPKKEILAKTTTTRDFVSFYFLSIFLSISIFLSFFRETPKFVATYLSRKWTERWRS
jgi:hypothetical protein